MISVLSTAPSSFVMPFIAQSQQVSLIHKLALNVFSYLATSLHIPASWNAAAISCLIGLSVALAVFHAMEGRSYEPYPMPIPYHHRSFLRPIEICRPPVSYPNSRRVFEHSLPRTSFQPRRDRVGERMPSRS
jgi:hypothetical protein